MKRSSSSPRPLVWLGVAAVAVGALAVFACSSTPTAAGPAQCNTNPWLCDPGQTCWPTSCACPQGSKTCDATNCFAQFSCVVADLSKRPYDTCHNSAAFVSCGEHQACIEVTAGKGVCLNYCDSTSTAHACTAGQQCLDYQVGQATGAPTVHVCVSDNPDGGPAHDAGPSDVQVGQPDVTVDGGPKPQ